MTDSGITLTTRVIRRATAGDLSRHDLHERFGHTVTAARAGQMVRVARRDTKIYVQEGDPYRDCDECCALEDLEQNAPTWLVSP